MDDSSTRPLFCQITDWWNWYYIKEQISPHFFYYPVKLMTEKGFNVEILTLLYPERNEAQYERRDHLEIYRFQRQSKRIAVHVQPSLCVHLFSHLLKKKYSLIHLHSINPVADYVTWMASRMKTTPMVFTTHHDPSPAFWESDSAQSLISRKVLRSKFVRDSATCVFVAFTKTQADAYKRLGIRNVRVIPHGIDTTPFQTQCKNEIRTKYRLQEYNILCVGVPEPRKGQHLLVKSMPAILKAYPATKLLLVGRTYVESQKQYLESLKSQVAQLGLASHVEFINDSTGNDLIQLYLSSSLFALPTEVEMFGLVFLEAMAAGLPIVTTDSKYLPHTKEILGNGEAGILVAREQKSLEDAIVNLLGDSALRKKIGSTGKSLVQKKYRLDKVIEQHWDLYRSLLE